MPNNVINKRREIQPECVAGVKFASIPLNADARPGNGKGDYGSFGPSMAKRPSLSALAISSA